MGGLGKHLGGEFNPNWQRPVTDPRPFSQAACAPGASLPCKIRSVSAVPSPLTDSSAEVFLVHKGQTVLLPCLASAPSFRSNRVSLQACPGAMPAHSLRRESFALPE